MFRKKIPFSGFLNPYIIQKNELLATLLKANFKLHLTRFYRMSPSWAIIRDYTFVY